MSCCQSFYHYCYYYYQYFVNHYVSLCLYFLYIVQPSQVTAQATCPDIDSNEVLIDIKAIVRPLQSLKTRTTRAAVIINVLYMGR